jgi:hypothetical protein
MYETIVSEDTLEHEATVNRAYFNVRLNTFSVTLNEKCTVVNTIY